MYTIKVDTELFDLLADEYGGMIEVLCRASEKLSSAADILSEIYGFGIEETADLVSIEAMFAEEIGENILMLCRKTEQVSEIYRMTDDKVTKDIEALPVLIHGNISSIGRYSDIVGSITVAGSDWHKVSESALLCNNTVMHEDWIIQLIVKNRYGGKHYE